MNELRNLKGKRPIMGFTQTDVQDCVKQYVDVKNPTIIKNAIYDAESHGWVARRKAHKHERNLFVSTKSGLAMYIILSDVLFDINLLTLYLEDPNKVRKEVKRLVTPLELILNGIISQLNLYKIIAGAGATPPGYQKIPNRLRLLEEIRDAMKGYNREVPGNIEAMRFCNIIKYLLEILKKMEVVGITALCNAADRIIDDADPLTWDENVLG